MRLMSFPTCARGACWICDILEAVGEQSLQEQILMESCQSLEDAN